MARGFIVHPTYRVRAGVPVVQLYGRLETGAAFLVEDDRFRPYFFATRESARALQGARGIEIAETELRDLRGRGLLRIETQKPAEVPPLRERIAAAGGEALEADLRFPYRFLIDRGIRATCEIEGRGELRRDEINPDGIVHFHNPALAPGPARVALRTLSLDLETTPDAGRILGAALVCGGVQEVHLLAKRKVAGAIAHPKEPGLIFSLLKRIRSLDPDLIVGWNVIDFDLRVLFARCDALRMECNLGRARDRPRILQREGSFMRQSRADVAGRMVVDGIPLVRDALRLPNYRLQTVAQRLLGRGKKIAEDAPDAAQEIMRMWREAPEALAEYNLEDARLALEILEHEGLLNLCVERSRLCGMQLDRVGASIASFDLLYLPELRRRGIVAPSVDASRKQAHVRGGTLLDPQPGLHRHVAVLDFKSLYPSLIRTFHLDPLARARAAQANGAKDAIAAPNGARFSREDSILPGVLERLAQRREQARARGDRHADYAIKIMMNALFGVLGAGACRFFDPQIANAITGFGQQTLHWTREAFEAEEVPVLYGDTDSVFVKLPEIQDARALRAAAERLRQSAQQTVAERIRREYRVEPRLELELERIFEHFFLPRLRGGRGGSKKRYAGWEARDGGRLVVVGLEAVRGDWPEAATRLQEGMLKRLFQGVDPAEFVRELVAALRAGQMDSELIYTKRVRKGALSNYTANAPHIQAARKAGARAGSTIQYLITHSGPEPVLPGQALPAGIDRTHYIEKVLRPVADSILLEIGSSFDRVLGVPHQISLFDPQPAAALRADSHSAGFAGTSSSSEASPGTPMRSGKP